MLLWIAIIRIIFVRIPVSFSYLNPSTLVSILPESLIGLFETSCLPVSLYSASKSVKYQVGFAEQIWGSPVLRKNGVTGKVVWDRSHFSVQTSVRYIKHNLKADLKGDKFSPQLLSLLAWSSFQNPFLRPCSTTQFLNNWTAHMIFWAFGSSVIKQS